MSAFTTIDREEQYDDSVPMWQSPSGALLDLDFDSRFDLKKIASREKNMWRYREAIPLKSDDNLVSFGEGYTPLLPVSFGGKTCLIKQEQLFSTGSYKDRGAAVLISKAKELGIRHVVQDSSGNAGCAIAAYAAKAGIACDIYLPEDTSPGKIAQIQLYGAQIHAIPGPRAEAAREAMQAARQTYYASHCWNPYFFHGTKTFAYEVCEQLGWKSPDAVVLPAGHGTLVIGCWLGFTDLLRAGIISSMPKLIAVQAENCAPLAAAFHSGISSPGEIVSHPTLAEGIAIAIPLRGEQILRYVKESGGTFLTVTEAAISDTLLECGRKGFYIEPTSAAAIAGLKQYVGMSSDQVIVSLFSGHGLKSTEKILKLASGQ